MEIDSPISSDIYLASNDRRREMKSETPRIKNERYDRVEEEIDELASDDNVEGSTSYSQRGGEGIMDIEDRWMKGRPCRWENCGFYPEQVDELVKHIHKGE